jgi:hypothetical protein
MDPARSANVRPEFIDILHNIEPIDARILNFLQSRGPNDPAIPKDQLGGYIACRQTAVTVSLANLHKLGCVRFAGGGHVVVLSELGHEIMIAIES